MPRALIELRISAASSNEQSEFERSGKVHNDVTVSAYAKFRPYTKQLFGGIE